MKRFWKTLRVRLAIWNAGAVILTAMVTLIGLQQGVRWALLHEMDQLLIEDIEEITLTLKELSAAEFDNYTEELNRKAIVHRHHGWFVELLSRDQTLLWKSVATPETALPFPALKVDSRKPYTFENYRLVVRQLKSPIHNVEAIRVGSSLTFLSEDLAIIDRFVLMAAGFVLVLAPLSGFLLAGRTVRSIGDIIQTAARLRPSHLDERLPLRGTEDELDQLAKTVNGLLDRIATYLQQKRDFLANAAHELRTPLAAIRSSVEVALNSNRSVEEYQELLIDIIDEGSALETLVNQLLLISETEAEKINSDFGTVMFHEVVQKAIDMFVGVAETREITLEARIEKPLTVPGIRGHLRQLVNNLIDNAIKYTPTGGKVTVTLTAPHANLIHLDVQDNGIGIAPEDLPHVFDRFFRAERSRTRQQEIVGTGLGLSICQAVVSAHKGSITCHSSSESGTCFTVRLPRGENDISHSGV
ncbi:MAG: HAMP domain-containing sensor histidine kinase [Planctomycetota bacterium]|nr:HAMP domain-containing sensor histidine kinase [Planctomycetota bacterium]MDA1212651.1 HAMP domain-containing sensor histidine kinase [Planctomycetota bacterium]